MDRSFRAKHANHETLALTSSLRTDRTGDPSSERDSVHGLHPEFRYPRRLIHTVGVSATRVFRHEMTGTTASNTAERWLRAPNLPAQNPFLRKALEGGGRLRKPDS